MGSRLVTAAWSFVASYNERARQDEQRELETTEVALLVLMAHTARDDDAEPWFQTERAKICTQLGIRDTEAGRKRVQRALGALAAAQAIALPEKYLRGYTPRYRLIYQGGCLASTPTPEVWTPGIPPTDSKGDAQRPGYGRPASRSVDAQHPPEEEGGTEEEEHTHASPDAPGSGNPPFELAPPPTPPWDAGLPEPTTAAEAARCPRHPTGTDGRCWDCGKSRQAWQAANPHGGRPRKRDVLRFRTEGGRRICDNFPHVATARGDCANCEIRAEDLALEIGATA